MRKTILFIGAAAALTIAAAAIAQTPANDPVTRRNNDARGPVGTTVRGQAPIGAAPAAAGRGAGRGAGANGVNPGFNSGGAGIGSAEVPGLIFSEGWRDIPMDQPMTQKHLSNSNLILHLYGDVAGIRATQHPTEAYTYTGETKTNWLITVSDPKYHYDLSGAGKVMLRTRNSGYRFTHVVIKTLDGNYYASEEGSPESTSWIEREYALADLHWRILLMKDTPSNASNRRQPDPNLTPIIPMGSAKPDLTKVDEVGFSDLMPGGWIPSTSRVNVWAVYGKKVPR